MERFSYNFQNAYLTEVYGNCAFQTVTLHWINCLCLKTCVKGSKLSRDLSEYSLLHKFLVHENKMYTNVTMATSFR